MSTQYHFVITITWVVGGLPRMSCSDGTVTAAKGQTRQDLYNLARQHVRRNNDAPDDFVVTFFSLEPNDLGGDQ